MKYIDSFNKVQLVDSMEILLKKAKFERNEEKKKPYQLIRNVTPEECNWLQKTYLKGEIVYRYYGATYKCIGKNGLAFCEVIDKNPFFELPMNAATPLII